MPTSKTTDAIALLKADHRKVEGLFEKALNARQDGRQAGTREADLYRALRPHDDRGRDLLSRLHR